MSRTKSFQNRPASSSPSGGGARRTRSSSNPSALSLPLQDASAANTTRWPRRRSTSAIPTQLFVGPYALSGANRTVSRRSVTVPPNVVPLCGRQAGRTPLWTGMQWMDSSRTFAPGPSAWIIFPSPL